MAEVIKPPFTVEFDGELIEEDGYKFVCRAKNVFVLKILLLSFVKKPPPLGQKYLVGGQINGPDMCYMWRDEHFTHIGCLKEKTTEFNKKYIQLVKHLNKKNDNVESKQSGGSANTEINKEEQK